MLKSLWSKADSLASEAKDRWLALIKKYASRDIMTVQEDKKVVEQLQDIMDWKIDFVVVKNKDKCIRGVIGRDQLQDMINEQRLQARTGATSEDPASVTFRDLIDRHDLKEYYVLDEQAASKATELWQGLPPRELILIRNKIVEAVVDRRWFRRWQSLVRSAAYY